jgi:hypothetical protein
VRGWGIEYVRGEELLGWKGRGFDTGEIEGMWEVRRFVWRLGFPGEAELAREKVVYRGS